MELAQFSEELVMWRKSVVGLLNASEKIHIEGRVASAKLDNAKLVVGDNGVAIAALERCYIKLTALCVIRSASRLHSSCVAGAFFVKKFDI